MNVDEPNQKRIRVEDNTDCKQVLLHIADIMKFYFDDSIKGIGPIFVHQNFDKDGTVACPTDYTPMDIAIHVDTKDLSVRVSFSHAGSADDIAFRVVVMGIISRLVCACDVGNGCKPAKYPGGFSTELTLPEVEIIQASEVFSLPDGFSVERYSSRDFAGRSLNIWKRAEWLMLWNIESVTESDHESDTNWEYYFLRDASGCIGAMCSVYKFPSFTFLSKDLLGERLRLSQFLTIPSKWNSGTGSRLLRFLAEYVISNKDIDMLTMEDPSLGMTSMRESVYLSLAKTAGIAKDEVSFESIAQKLKIPHSFAKRIQSLLEMERLRKGRQISSMLVNEVANSNNKLVSKFIDKIEFYDDDEATDEPLSEEKSKKLINEAIRGALLKLNKIMSSGA